MLGEPVGGFWAGLVRATDVAADGLVLGDPVGGFWAIAGPGLPGVRFQPALLMHSLNLLAIVPLFSAVMGVASLLLKSRAVSALHMF